MTRKTVFACLIFFIALFFLLGNTAVAAVPVESSHYNSNTYANLNTITNTGDITFTINYDVAGDIKWYKDGTLIQTDANASVATLTTNWTENDYNKLKELKVNSTTADGISEDTVWKVEVQETGTANIAKHTAYPQRRVGGKNTLYVKDGWANLPSLYLAGKQPDNDWIEYVKAKTYILKKSVMVNGLGGTLYITADTVKEIKMTSDNPPIQIVVYENGTINIDKVNIYGWNIANARETLGSETSPVIKSQGNNTLNITNSHFRHVEIYYEVDQSAGDIVDNNTFYEGKPYNIDLKDGYSANSSKGQIITNNTFIETGSSAQNMGSHRRLESPGTIVANNRFVSDTDAANIQIAKKTEFTGNDVSYSSWNLIEFPDYAFSKYSNFHDNGGKHNGFNMLNYAYSVNDYCHDFTGYSCWYIQVQQNGSTNPADYTLQRHGYILNGYAKDANMPGGGGCGINIFGAYDMYIYNFTADNSSNNVQYGSDHLVFRKSRFFNSPDRQAFRFVDVSTAEMGKVENMYFIDSEFSDTNKWDYYIHSNPSDNGNPIVHSINTYRKNSDGTLQTPVITIYGAGWNGEVRNYAYLDTLVQDASGTPISGATITIEPLTDVNFPAVNVVLPPPPPDLASYPEEQLPIPTVESFTNITTDATGHTPRPNYGWSNDSEATPALLFSHQLSSNRNYSDFQYRITATYNEQSVSTVVTPDVSWYREDPTQLSKTVVLTFDKPAEKYALNVNGGTGDGVYSAGQSVNIVAGPAPAGKVFDKWIGDTTGIADVNASSTSITVQAADASITAYYKDITYHLTVVGGTGSGDYPAGKIVVADASPTNGEQVFYKWTGDVEHVISPTVYSSTLIMPDHDLTVNATYRDPISYSCHLTVAEGEGTDFYAPGENVAISAPQSPSIDKVFDHWAGDTNNLADIRACNTTLTTIPDEYLILYPVYRDSGAAPLTIEVTGVTLNPTTLSLAAGTSRTLTATVVPENATIKNVTWVSSNTAVATVDSNGQVTGKAAGTAVITVTTVDGKFQQTCSVNVTASSSGGSSGSSGSSGNNGGSSGGSGGGGSAGSVKVPVNTEETLPEKHQGLHNINTEDDGLLNTALKATGQARLDLSKDSDGKVILSLATIKELGETTKYLLLQNQTQGLKIDLTTLNLESISGSVQDTVEFQVKPLTKAEKTALLQKMAAAESSGIADIGENIYNFAVTMNVLANGSKSSKNMENFSEPVAVTVDLSKYTLTPEQVRQVCGMRLEKNGKGEIIPVKLGGNYDAASKTLTFYTDKAGYCTVMSSQALTKLTLFINNNVTSVNDLYKTIDVPPTLINNRTMVPLRYIGEAFGAEFDWDEQTRTVTVKNDQQEIKLVIDQPAPGLDSPPTIVGGRTLVPVRYISETFGAQVMWFPSTQTVMVVK